ncbi:hypothetical protein C7S17_5322 [Burkholderia thailandensis]|nr:hypothetical protein [Burkholderia thailandensis]
MSSPVGLIPRADSTSPPPLASNSLDKSSIYEHKIVNRTFPVRS